MDDKPTAQKAKILLWIVAGIFIVIFSRLAYLQLWKNNRYETLARENHIRLTPIYAPRGEIYDDQGVEIAGNQPSYTVTVSNTGKGINPKVVNKVVNLLGLDPTTVAQKIKDALPGQSVRLATNVSIADVTKIEERSIELPGVVVDTEPLRYYPIKSAEGHSILSNVLGYVQEIKKNQLTANKDKGYLPGDIYGQDGLEETFQPYLRGQDGAREVEVNAQGQPVRSLGLKNPVPGDNLTLSINAKLEQDTEAALADSLQSAQSQGITATGGAAVMVDVHTGAVKAMASYPSYDPAAFEGGLNQSLWQQYLNDDAFLNRAIQAYPPGSTFKMVLAAAALQLGKITPNWTIFDPGYYMDGNHVFHDWLAGGHGIVDVEKAITESCDTFFYTVGNRLLGVNNIRKFALMFGLGQKTGIELPGEQAGVVPSPAYKYQINKAYLNAEFNPKFKAVDNQYDPQIAAATDPQAKARLQQAKEKALKALQTQYNSYSWGLHWQAYDTINMSIGQGYNLYTPLQLADYVATIANGGYRYKPYLVSKITAPNGKLVKQFKPTFLGKVGVAPENLQVIRQGMYGTANDPNGTAYGVFTGLPFKVGAKTGTAQVAGHGDDALLVAFAPYDHPQVAVAVVVQYAGEGSSYAGPVADAMLASYANLAGYNNKVN